ncbi:dynein axonemal assembly factor 8 [Ctenodactylus gundi]
MASKDGATAPSLCSPWDAILQAARDQIPSLDSDSSLSDFGEEELSIFQRNPPALIPDLSEELAEDRAGGDISRTWVPVTLPESVLVPEGPATTDPGREWNTSTRTKDVGSEAGRGCGQPLESCAETCTLPVMANETSKWLEGDPSSLSFNNKGSQSPPQGTQGQPTLSPEGELRRESLAMHRVLCWERRKVEEDVLQNPRTWRPTCSDQGQAGRGEPKPEELPEGCPVLSLKQLEEWDLDSILQSLPEQEDSQGRGAPRMAWWAADGHQDPGHTTPRSQDGLLEQLVQVCAAQSRAATSARKVPIQPQDPEEQKAESRCAPAKPGFQADLGHKMAEGMRLKTEPPTIFIDLRQAQPRDPQAQTPESTSHSSSDSDEDEDEDEETAALGDQQGSAYPTPTSSRGPRDCTGKCQLLQQLRAFRNRTAPPKLPASEGHSGQETRAAEDVARAMNGRKEHVKLRAERQSGPARLPGGHPDVPESARKTLESQDTETTATPDPLCLYSGGTIGYVAVGP